MSQMLSNKDMSTEAGIPIAVNHYLAMPHEGIEALLFGVVIC
jgi:hypothetical protein